MTPTPAVPEDPERPEWSPPERTPEPGVALELPRGPVGLWGALATVSVPSIGARELPVVDTAGFGSGSTPFDYDPLLAVDLDAALDAGIDGLPGPDPVAG